MSRLLLDTHVVLWWRDDDARLGRAARQAIRDGTTVYVSLASAWEAAIKMSIGKLRLPATFEHEVRDSDFEPLPITFAHTEAVAALPLHHRDPFDRMLVAQCQVEGLVLVTHDRRIEPYAVRVLWA